MFRKFVAPAVVAGLSLVSGAALAENLDPAPPAVQAEPPPPAKPPPYVPNVSMSTRKGDEQDSRFLPAAEDAEPPSMNFAVSEGLLDKTVAMPVDMRGVPNMDLGYSYDKDAKTVQAGFKIDDGTNLFSAGVNDTGGAYFVGAGQSMVIPGAGSSPMAIATESAAAALAFVPDLPGVGTP